METVIKFLAGVMAVFGLMFLLLLLLAYPIMWSWNYTFPAVFGLPEITVWQALWGSVCIRLIFPSSTSTTTSGK